jgi:hypothetical protein
MVPHFSPKCLGFIFFDFFSNVGPTGCRRGRTPERSLRQPSKVWRFMPGLCFVFGLHADVHETGVLTCHLNLRTQDRMSTLIDKRWPST